jgi:hypothetical protein
MITLEKLAKELNFNEINQEIVVAGVTTSGGSSGETGEWTFTTTCDSRGNCRMSLIYQA